MIAVNTLFFSDDQFLLRHPQTDEFLIIEINRISTAVSHYGIADKCPS